MTGVIATRATPRKSRVIGLWVLRVLVAVAFVATGIPKLRGTPVAVALFATVGAGQWLRVVTGLLEVGSALALFVPRLTFYAAVLLAAVMVGAVTAHLTVLGGNPVPAVVLLLLSGSIAWLRRDARAGQ